MDLDTKLESLFIAIESQNAADANREARDILRTIANGDVPAGHNREGLTELCNEVISATDTMLAEINLVLENEIEFKNNLIEEIINFGR